MKIEVAGKIYTCVGVVNETEKGVPGISLGNNIFNLSIHRYENNFLFQLKKKVQRNTYPTIGTADVMEISMPFAHDEKGIVAVQCETSVTLHNVEDSTLKLRYRKGFMSDSAIFTIPKCVLEGNSQPEINPCNPCSKKDKHCVCANAEALENL